MSVYSTGTTVHVLVSHNSSDDKRAGANWMTTFEVSDDVIRGNVLSKWINTSYFESYLSVKIAVYCDPALY